MKNSKFWVKIGVFCLILSIFIGCATFKKFIEDVIQARSLSVLPITPRIAVLAQSELFIHGDPADRIIAATAVILEARLVTADERLRRAAQVRVLW